MSEISPAISVADENGNITWIEAEGGFREGVKATVRLDGDQWDGKTFVVSRVRSERTVDITNGPSVGFYCVGALRLE